MFSQILYTAELSRFCAGSQAEPLFLIPTRWARWGCALCAWVYSGWKMEGGGGGRCATSLEFVILLGPLGAAACSVQRMGTWGLRAWCISAISWFPEPLTLIKRIYWFSALIGSDAPQWFYNTRWPHTWDLLALNLKFTVLARLIGSDKFKCMRRFCRCIKQEIRRPLGAPGSPFYFDVSYLFSCCCSVSSLFISTFYSIWGVDAKWTPWNQCCDPQTISEPFTQCCRKHDPAERGHFHEGILFPWRLVFGLQHFLAKGGRYQSNIHINHLALP